MKPQSTPFYCVLADGMALLVVKASRQDAHLALRAVGIECASTPEELPCTHAEVLGLAGLALAQYGAVWRAGAVGQPFERLLGAGRSGHSLTLLARTAVREALAAQGDPALQRAAESLSAACFGSLTGAPRAGAKLLCTRLQDGQAAMLTLRAVLLDPEPTRNDVFYLLGAEDMQPDLTTPRWGDGTWSIEAVTVR